MTKDELTKKFPYPCDTCGDYEYCAGHYGEDECTGYIGAVIIDPSIGAITDV